MNRKLTVKTQHGDICYCVLAADRDYEEQLLEVLGMRRGWGRCVEMGKKRIDVLDTYTRETIGSFEILHMEDTGLPVTLEWVTLG